MGLEYSFDKEGVVNMHNEILLSHKKEHIWLRSKKVDKPRAYYAVWKKSETERQISYINAYVLNLERWYWWTSLQGSNGDTDIEKRLVDSSGDGEGETNRVCIIETYT